MAKELHSKARGWGFVVRMHLVSLILSAGIAAWAGWHYVMSTLSDGMAAGYANWLSTWLRVRFSPMLSDTDPGKVYLQRIAEEQSTTKFVVDTTEAIFIHWPVGGMVLATILWVGIATWRKHRDNQKTQTKE